MNPFDPASSCALALFASAALATSTAAQTCPVTLDIYPGSTDGVEPQLAADAHGDVAYMTADDGVHGVELWRWDIVGGLQRLSDGSGALDGAQGAPTVVWLGGERRVLFSGRDGDKGFEPFLSDGTPAGTVQLRDVKVGVESSDPAEFLSLGDQVLFAATTNTARLLLKTDGTTAGTGLVKSIAAGGPTEPTELARFGSRVLFSGESFGAGAEPWVSDGTAAGTFALGDLWPGSQGSEPAGFTPVGDFAVFAAEDFLFGRELYVTDGTPGGTQLLFDFQPGAVDGNPSDFTYWQGFVYFTASSHITGPELWRTDGTVAGTRLVADLNPGPIGSMPRTLVAAGDRLYFGARMAGSTGGTIDVLWELPAATGVPTIVSDVHFGDEGTITFGDPPVIPVEFPTLVPADSGVYFVGSGSSTTGPITGDELYFAAGGVASVVCDLNPGSSSSSPELGQAIGDHLFWLARDPVFGSEPRYIPIGGARAVDLGFGGPSLGLEMGPPSLGSTVSLSVRGGDPGELLLLGFGPRTEPSGAFVTDHSALWLDPFAAQLIASGAGPSLSTSYALPPGPSLSGVRAHVQAFGLANGGLQITASNGVAIELGT